MDGNRLQVEEDYSEWHHAADDNNHAQYGSVTLIVQRMGSRSWKILELSMLFKTARPKPTTRLNIILRFYIELWLVKRHKSGKYFL